MKRHLEEHFKDKNHVCKTCGKAFQRHYYLTEHERIHSGRLDAYFRYTTHYFITIF